MKKALLVCALTIPVVALGTYLAFGRQPRAEGSARAGQAPQTEQGLRAGTFEPPREAPAFTLDGSNGKKLSLRDHRGKVVILEFGYTFCQYVCPTTLARLKEVHQKLGDAASDVQLIFVTVDPKRDNPERMREYLTAFNPNFLGATGASDELIAVEKAYGIVAEQVVSKNKALGYEMEHSSFLYLIDRQGKIGGLVPYGTSADDMVHDLQLLLKTST